MTNRNDLDNQDIHHGRIALGGEVGATDGGWRIAG